MSSVSIEPMKNGHTRTGDANTRQVMAFHVGDRRRESAQELWTNIPVAYREQARFHTDQYEAYKSVIPAERHQAMTKHARKTNHIERFNATLRRHLFHLVSEMFVVLQEIGQPQSDLDRGLTPYEYICQCWHKEPERFTMKPYHHTLGLNI